MGQENARREWNLIHNIVSSLPRYKKRAERTIIAFTLSTILAIFLSTLVPNLTAAQELTYPDPFEPKNNATGVAASNVQFAWKPFYAGILKYSFELSENFDMSAPVTAIEVAGTRYTYHGTLKYDTRYYWRVIASEPPGGTWSPISNFKTQAKPSAAPPSDSSSPSNTEGTDWLLIGLIIAGIAVVALFIFILMKPKTQLRSQNQWQRFQQQPTGYQQTSTCPSCGSSNPPGQKFCNNCGTSLLGRVQQQVTDTQQGTVCPACGSTNSPERKFCNNCGTSLLSKGQQQSQEIHQAYTCPICGAALVTGSNPCPNCGTWLNWEA